MSDSRIGGFFRKSVPDRLQLLIDRGFLGEAERAALLDGQPLLPMSIADRMIENVIGVFGLPFAVAPNFIVNDRHYVVPMVVEEPSIVAGVSGAAKLFSANGGFRVTSTDPLLVGQIQLTGIEDPDRVVQALYAAEQELLALANELQPRLVARGGGARGIEYFKFRLPDGQWTVVLHLLVNTCDAMGANMVNTMCEGLGERVAAICGAELRLRILSNLADKALVRVRGRLSLSALHADAERAAAIRDAIVMANDFANTDPYRAATHNKGIMNGVDAVAIATGNDWRAIEAAAHAFAVRGGRYRSLTNWTVDEDDLKGELIMPMKVGTVGGSLTTNPGARLGLKICGATSARELAELIGAVGLAQNFAALRALVTDGIQKGHMSLHARSVAATAGVPENLFDEVVAGMIESGEVKEWKAAELLAGLGEGSSELPELSDLDVYRGSAAGKVILLGEHAAVYDRHVLALPLPNAMTAEVAETDGDIRLVVPDWKLDAAWKPDAVADTDAASVVALILRSMEADGRGFEIRVRSRIPVAVGLGSSAAFAVSIIRALGNCLGRGMSDVEVDRLAFECERLTHGTPSGIDNNIATFGEPVLYTRGSRSRTRPIELKERPPLVIAVSSSRGITKNMVAAVRERYERNRELFTTIFDEIDEISMAGALALRESDYELLGGLMNVCHGLLNAIGVSTPELEKMIDIARKNGALGAKLTGAGGGGSIVALCPDKVAEVSKALSDQGFRIVRVD